MHPLVDSCVFLYQVSDHAEIKFNRKKAFLRDKLSLICPLKVVLLGFLRGYFVKELKAHILAPGASTRSETDITQSCCLVSERL